MKTTLSFVSLFIINIMLKCIIMITSGHILDLDHINQKTGKNRDIIFGNLFVYVLCLLACLLVGWRQKPDFICITDSFHFFIVFG